MRRISLGSLLGACLILGVGAQKVPMGYESPSGERYVVIQTEGETVLPHGRILTPQGRQYRIPPHPFGMAMSADGKVLVTVNGGTGPFSITVVKNPNSANPLISQIPPYNEQSNDTNRDLLHSTFIGAAVDDLNDLIYASGADKGTIELFKISNGAKVHTIELSSTQYPDAYTTDLALSKDGKTLYALDLANYRMAVINTQTRRVIASVGVGRNPFALTLTPDGKRVYVANTGTFQYAPIEKVAGKDPRGIDFPPFGYPSKEAKEGVVVDGRQVPGLGDPNAPEACSVWGIDITEPQHLKVTVRIKTGLMIGKEAIGGSSPAGLVATRDRLYVSNSVNDSIEAYDVRTHKRLWRTVIAPVKELSGLRGVLPFGLALSPDGKRLYVAESGINAVGVLEAQTGKVLGHIPVGWYPARVAVSPDGKHLYVSNGKGFGAGPNGGPNFKRGPEGTYVGRLMRGSLSLMNTPSDSELPALTRKTLENNGMIAKPILREAGNPIPAMHGNPSSKIKYVVFITKENRTFDEVFGDLPGVRGEPSLARFGENRRVGALEGVTIMPNHRELAKRFAISDNFHVNSDVSADGHRWLVGNYTNHWTESITAAGYGGGASYRTSAPGRLALFGSNSSLTPEDYLEHGSMWEHFERHRISFRNYGEGFEFAGISEDEDTKPTGARLALNIPMPKVLWDNTCRTYPGYNMNIPDQYRADQFLKDLNERFLSGKEAFPRFIYIHLPNDHGAGAKPNKGYPFNESYMADNDLALGRIVEALSQTPYWREMAIFVTEDDAQAGVDSVDAHRSILMVISPYAKRGHISRRTTSISSILKTIFLILGMKPLNYYDVLSTDFADCFGSLPDFSSYKALPVDPRIFDPEKAKDPNDPDYRKAAREPSPAMDEMGEALRQIGEKKD